MLSVMISKPRLGLISLQSPLKNLWDRSRRGSDDLAIISSSRRLVLAPISSVSRREPHALADKWHPVAHCFSDLCLIIAALEPS